MQNRRRRFIPAHVGFDVGGAPTYSRLIPITRAPSAEPAQQNEKPSAVDEILAIYERRRIRARDRAQIVADDVLAYWERERRKLQA